jgi:hypothetical protein
MRHRGQRRRGVGQTSLQRLLAGRLRAARKHCFVGRDAERVLFASALCGTGQRFAALYLHGPAGIGKSTLLRQLSDDATGAHRRGVPVCGRVVGASVAAFTDAASPTLSDPRAVLMIDAFEWCHELEGWLREHFLPQLPDGVLVALAGASTPGACVACRPVLVWRPTGAWPRRPVSARRPTIVGIAGGAGRCSRVRAGLRRRAPTGSVTGRRDGLALLRCDGQ